MTIYFINKTVGKTNSGVEHAQKYRYEVLKSIKEDVKLIFVRPTDNLYDNAVALGIAREDVKYMPDELVGEVGEVAKVQKRQGDFVFTGSKATLTWIDEGKAEEDDDFFAQLVYHTGEMKVFFTKQELYQYYYEHELNAQSDDIAFLDRGDETAPALLRANLPWKKGVVVHAEHRAPDSRDQAIGEMLWNNYYEFEFTHAKRMDFFLAATEAQKQQLEADFKFIGNVHAPVYAIPVGGVAEDVLTAERRPIAKRQPHSLITVSRIAFEKHIEHMINALAQVVKVDGLADTTLSIYGVGGEQEQLTEQAKALGIENRVLFKGHRYDLAEAYSNAQLYVSASTSEGFGLTYLESLSYGTPIVGIKVPYGITEMVDQQGDGGLTPLNKENEPAMVDGLANLIIERLQNPEMLEAESIAAKAVSQNYSQAEIGKKYQKLIKTLQKQND